MRSLPLLRLGAAALALAGFAAPRAADAFCGFYVAGAEQRLLNEATVVALVRDGTRTTLSMQNHYRGPPEAFALVVPVPVVLKKEDVKTLPREVFDHLDRLTAPRLVEYWEQDPCGPVAGRLSGGLRMGAGGLAGAGDASGDRAVKVEARFAVGEYDVVVLGAGDSLSLASWLTGHGYRLPEGAAAALRPYVEGGMKFFVARVSPARVTFHDGAAVLSPIRVAYDAETFSLPVRLGLLSSPGTQELIVHVIAPGQRYAVANRPSLTVPTNVDVAPEVRDRFGAFYAALFDRTVAAAPGAAVTEYAWSTWSCDPCPVPPLTDVELATLGAEPYRTVEDTASTRALSPVGSASIRGAKVEGGTVANAPAVVAGMTAGFRRCYNKALQEDPQMKGDVRVVARIGANGEVLSAVPAGHGLSGAALACLAARVSSAQFAPPEGGSATVTITAAFESASAAQPRPAGQPPPPRLRTVAQSFVLTRLHLRYGKDSLGEDLVFQAAPPIAGGLESMADTQGTAGASENQLQARYVIRHAWEGTIGCADPKRGTWGPAPPGMPALAPRTAQDLASAPRGGVDLGSLVRAAVPALGLQGPAAPAEAARPEAGPAPAEEARTPSRGCGACATAPPASGREGAIALALAALAAWGTRVARRRGALAGSSTRSISSWGRR